MALLQLTDGLGWMTAFFQSMTARTAGFCTVDFSTLSNAGLLVIMLLMFIGASPGSTGGGIKTTTFFCADAAGAVDLLQAAARRIPPPPAGRCAAQGCDHHPDGDHRCSGRHLRPLHPEPETDFVRLLFEQISAYSTSGLSTGITAGLCAGSRVLLILTMFIGRVGAVTLLSLWGRAPRAHRPLYRRSPSRLGKYEAARQPP